jgi:hypothetical protein
MAARAEASLAPNNFARSSAAALASCNERRSAPSSEALSAALRNHLRLSAVSPRDHNVCAARSAT